ncbi:helix-turn-helix transcriptional regulator [Pseudomonas putida]|nr:helix-turn-helix transcriptional regulator [Pseudomonas putida]
MHNLSVELFSDLVGKLYQGPRETIPWATFLNQLNVQMRSKYVTFMLRPPSHLDVGLMINTTGSTAEITSSYNQYFFALDPFVDLPNRQVVTNSEFITDNNWLNSEFYKSFLEPLDVFHILGADITTCDGVNCRIRISRSRSAPAFGDEEKALLAQFIPHLERSVEIHTQLNRIVTERNLYAEAVDQLEVGTILLDEAGRVLQTNEVANGLIQAKDGIRLVQDSLVVGSSRETQEFRRLVKRSLLSHKSNTPSVVEALRVKRTSGRADLGIIVRSVPPLEWSEGKQCPAVVIFISDPERHSSAPKEIVSALFSLTPAETSLAMLLANGLTKDEASKELGISTNTARAHLRSIFSKTGVTRQTMLVRLILRSVATLG